MAVNKWQGGAASIPQVDRITFAEIRSGDTVVFTIGTKTVSVESTSDSIPTFIADCVTAIGQYSNTIAEFAEVSASAGTNEAGQADSLLITGPTDGKPFTLSTSADTAGVTISRRQKYDGGQAHVQTVNVSPATGGTFTLTFDGQTTAAIAYNAAAATVAAALELLSNIDDVSVTGSAGGPWDVEFNGRYNRSDVSLMSGDGSSLTITGSYTMDISNIQNERIGSNQVQRIQLMDTPTGGTFTVTYAGQTTAGIAYNASASTVETAITGLSTVGAGNVSVTQIEDFAYLVEFIGDFRGVDADVLVVDGDSLTGGTLGTVTRSQAARDGTNAVYKIEQNGSAWKITLTEENGRTSTTQAISATATAIDVHQSIRNTIGDGAFVTNVNSEDRADHRGGPWNVEFSGQFAGTTLTAANSENATVTQVTAGSNTQVAEVQKITFVGNNQNVIVAGSATKNQGWVVNFAGGTSYGISFGIDATDIDTSYITNSLALCGATATVTYELLANATVFTITFDTDEHKQDVPLLTIAEATTSDSILTDPSGPTTSNVTSQTTIGVGDSEIVTDATPTQNAIRRLEFETTPPGGGTFTLTQNSNTTAAIAYDASSEDVESALEAIASITDVAVAGNVGGPWEIEFIDYTGDPTITSTLTSLSGVGVDVSQAQAAIAPTPDIQRLTLEGSPISGTYTLTYGAVTTSAINYNASATSIHRELRDSLSGVLIAQTVTVSQVDDYNYDIVFAWTSGTNPGTVSLLSATSSLTGATTTRINEVTETSPQSPFHFDADDNWSSGTAPTTGDDVYFESSDDDCLYGLDQSAVTLTSLHIASSYTGDIGLKNRNEDYYEYRDTMLAIGATNVYVGEGEGTGSGRVKLDFGAIQTTVLVRNTGVAEDEAIGALVVAGTHASNVLRVLRGSVGVATNEPEQLSTFATIDESWIDAQDTDAEIIVGSDVTLTTVTQSGGSFDCRSNITTYTNRGGTGTIAGSATVATLDASGGTVYYESSGTLSQGYARAGATVSFDRDLRSRTVTDLTVFAGSTVSDRSRTVTWTNPIKVSGCSLQDLDLELGTNISVAVASL